jgi:sulfatase maturation enzyme AslB (radical SAM superfamily)
VASDNPELKKSSGLPSASFCVLPWMHLFADENGVMYPCCRSVGSQLPNVDERNGKPYKIQDEGGLEEGWNSAYMRDLRREMLAGSRPKPCERCYMYEDLGMRSHRQSQNTQYLKQVSGLLARTDEDGRTPLDLQSVDIRLGNLCNLRCRMCSPQSSKVLIEEWAALHGVPSSHPYFEELRQLDWFSQPTFWRIFQKHTANIERLHFAGGEPLLIEPMFDFLQRLIEDGRAKEITISYNTNLTVLPRRVFDLWPHFRSVRVTVSLDGFGDVNGLIRYPSRWATIDRNLKMLDAEAERLNCGGGLSFNTTVQVYNIFRLDEFVEYAASSFTRFEAPNLSILSVPEHFNIRILPPEMKERAAARLLNLTERMATRWPERWQGRQVRDLLAATHGIIDHMMSADRRDLLPEFLRWCKHQDRFRGQDVLKVIPELAPIFETAPVI